MKKAPALLAFLALSLGFASTATAGQYPEHAQMRKVKYLAHELYKGARYLYEHSARYTRHASYSEYEALEDLDRLARRSHHFYEQVGRYYRQPRHTERDFRRLLRAYRAASRGFHDLSTYRRYHDDFECLIETMDKLVHYYGGYGYYSADYDHGYRGKRHDDYHRREHKAAHILKGAYHILRVIDDDDDDDD